MPTQSYENHRHNPRPTGVGFLFVIVAIVGFTIGGSAAADGHSRWGSPG